MESSTIDRRRRQLLALGTAFGALGLGGCGGGGQGHGDEPDDGGHAPAPAPAPVPNPETPATKSAKRGIAFDLADPADLQALAPGVSWWYDWGLRPAATVPKDFRVRHGMDFHPMLWNDAFNDTEAEALLLANPHLKYLMVLNEPNCLDQSNLLPSLAAQAWPRYERLAQRTSVQLVGPAMTWGTMPGFEDPVAWLDAFHASYRAHNAGRSPRIDCLAFHWYDYGLAGQLDRLTRYGKPFWVTEFANWHSQPDGAQIDTVAKQMAQMSEMVAICEARADVMRYAWFTGRWDQDVHHTSLLGAAGRLTELGRHYISLPFKA